MKKTVLYCLWAFFYLLCGFLSYITQPTYAQSVALTLLSVVFFVPGALLLIDAFKQQDAKELRRLRLISLLSLTLTLAVFIANIASVGGSEALGQVLYQVLIYVSVPMVCSQHYVLSLFLWACLLFSTFINQKKSN